MDGQAETFDATGIFYLSKSSAICIPSSWLWVAAILVICKLGVGLEMP
jgi:hypothetical protein